MNTPSYLDTLEVAHDLAWKAAKKISLSADETNHLAGIMYFEIIELAGSAIILRRNRRVAGVSLIARTALDAFVDLKNLLIYPDYWATLEASDSREWRKILQAAHKPGNQYLAGFRADPAFPDYQKQMKRRLKDAIAVSATKLRAEERFARVGMQNEFAGLYTALSSDVHNNTGHLKYRHTRVEGDTFVFTLYSGEGGYGDAVLFTLSEILLFASEDMHERYGAGKDVVKGIRYVVEPARERAARLDKDQAPQPPHPATSAIS
jgi:hypothetical protein